MTDTHAQIATKLANIQPTLTEAQLAQVIDILEWNTNRVLDRVECAGQVSVHLSEGEIYRENLKAVAEGREDRTRKSFDEMEQFARKADGLDRSGISGSELNEVMVNIAEQKPARSDYYIITKKAFFHHQDYDSAVKEQARLSAKCPKETFQILRVIGSVEASGVDCPACNAIGFTYPADQGERQDCKTCDGTGSIA